MSKFKVGDKARVVSARNANGLPVGTVVTIDEDNSRCPWVTSTVPDSDGDLRTTVSEDSMELVTNNEVEKKMGRRTFKLLKDTPELSKGALFQEECEDGTQPYSCISLVEHDKAIYHASLVRIADRQLVEDQPQWFVEVFKVTPEYMTQEELDQWEAFKSTKTVKRGRPVGSKKAKK